MEEMYNDNDIYILSPHQFVSQLKYIYNFPINKRVDQGDIRNILETIYHHPKQGKAFKFTLSAGIIMENREDGTLRYFKPAMNVTILPDPILVKDRRGLQRAINKLQNMDIDELIRNYRPNTKWIVKFVTNLEVNVYNTLYTLGSDEEQLPEYIRRNKFIQTYCRNVSIADRQKYCMFIALAQHHNPNEKHRFKQDAFRHAYRWKEYLERITGEDVKDYTTVEFADIPHFEECFGVNVNVYELQADGTALSRYKSIGKYVEELNLNVFNNHVNRITDVGKYANGYECIYCSSLFRYPSYVRRHEKTCTQKTKLIFKGGAYKAPVTLFDKLEEVGIKVPHSKRFFPYFICFDFEAILVKEPIERTERMKYTHRHVAVSCSLASNIPGHTKPVCVIDESEDGLVNKMFEQLDKIRVHGVACTQGKWRKYMERLKIKILEREYEVKAELTAEDWENIGGNDAALEKHMQKDVMHRRLCQLEKEFIKYVNQMIVIGFNNSRYDEQLIKRPLVKYLIEQKNIGVVHKCHQCGDVYVPDANSPLYKHYLVEDANECHIHLDYADTEMGEVNVIKRGNAYVSIRNNFYHFIDICQFLPPATSYDKFLNAYGIKNGKQYFCYEWLDSFEKLNEQLPPYPGEAWYSTLKDKDILDDEYQQYCKNGMKGDRPLSGEEKYQQIQRLWEANGWNSMKDLLIFYNNADVEPFVKATVIMLAEYFEQKIDVFKIAVSIPGVSKYKMMQYATKANIMFPMFSQKDKDLYFMFKSQLCAGASLIITRLAQVDVTPIKANSDKVVKSCIGLDANALYCAQLGLEMPSYAYVRRRREKYFTPEFNSVYYAMQVWLKHLSESTGLVFKTQRNSGSEVKVGPYYLDGYALTDSKQQVAAEFNGCFFHQHTNCELYKKQTSAERYVKTIKKREYLEEKGFKVITMWECDFIRTMANNPVLQTDYNKYKPNFYKKHNRAVTQEQILHAIANGELYGYALVNIYVPEPLREAFDTFPPIFCNHTVEKEHLSPHMLHHVEKQGIKFDKGRRLLLTGMEAEEILLSSKMIEWCLKHGLRVSKVWEVVEFVPSRPFKEFVDDVADRRLQGARDPNKKIIAEIYKLMGWVCKRNALKKCMS